MCDQVLSSVPEPIGVPAEEAVLMGKESFVCPCAMSLWPVYEYSCYVAVSSLMSAELKFDCEMSLP